ncbi:MAG: hypothetical protein VX899_14610 [Myxococcota bacterium]|nr:hypothetical protein [Myxococcota bacterium]
MVLVALLLGCAEQPAFDPSGLAALSCSSTVESMSWDEQVDGVSFGELRDSVVGRQSFLNQNPDELLSEISVLLSTSEDMPARITWEGDDCPGPEYRVPLAGRWDIEGVEPTRDAACVLDQGAHLQCVGALEHDEDLEAKLREYGPEGAGFFVNPPLILDWEVDQGTAAAEVWLDFTDFVDDQEAVVAMHDLVHQPDGR